MITIPSFLFRVLHQCRTDGRHFRFWCAIYAGWLAAKTLHIMMHERWVYPEDLDLTVQSITLGGAACISFACSWADAPANTDTASLSKPMGQGSIWLGKALFLTCGVLIPMWLSDAINWLNFGLSAPLWLALSAGSLLSYGVVIALSAVLAGSAATSRQAIAAASLGLLLGVAWWIGSENLLDSLGASRDPVTDVDISSSSTQHECGRIAGCVFMLAGALTAWWWVTVRRRRLVAAGVIALALLAGPLAERFWRSPDWLAVSPQFFPKGRLIVKTGKADPGDKTPGRALWPTLRITGFQPDEVPSIVGFGPEASPGGEAWKPPLGSYTDLPKASNWPDCWMPIEQLRAISRHFPPTDIWNTYWNKTTNNRPSLKEALKPLHLDFQKDPAPWHLRIVVHAMRQIGEVPLKDLMSQRRTIVIEPGLRMELDPVRWETSAYELHGRFHRLSSRLMPASPYLELREQFRNEGLDHLGLAMIVVFRDPIGREDYSNEAGMSPQNRWVTFGFQENQITPFEIRYWGPRSRFILLGEKPEDWINRTTLTFWMPEERGSADLVLDAEQMREVLAPLQPLPANSGIPGQVKEIPPAKEIPSP